jgi:hypothetical protein
MILRSAERRFMNPETSKVKAMKAFQNIIQYVKALLGITEKRHPDYVVNRAKPETFFQGVSGNSTTGRVATIDEISKILRDYDIKPGSPNYRALIAGEPFKVDGGTMRFVRLPEGFTPPSAQTSLKHRQV